MKNFFKTTLYISAFALAGVFFQVACSNDNNSSPAAINKILYSKLVAGLGYEMWYCDIDGANPTQIPLNLPSGVYYSNANANIYSKFSPDGTRVFFSAVDQTAGENKIYSCNLDGSDLQLIIAPSSQAVILDDIQ